MKERLLSTKRVSARHQVNGRIVVSKRAFCSKTGPAEETGFLRSVRILQVRNFSGLKGRLASSLPASSLRLPGTRLKSDPDVFADALVPSEPGKSLPALSQYFPDIDGRHPGGSGVALPTLCRREAPRLVDHTVRRSLFVVRIVSGVLHHRLSRVMTAGRAVASRRGLPCTMSANG